MTDEQKNELLNKVTSALREATNSIEIEEIKEAKISVLTLAMIDRGDSFETAMRTRGCSEDLIYGFVNNLRDEDRNAFRQLLKITSFSVLTDIGNE